MESTEGNLPVTDQVELDALKVEVDYVAGLAGVVPPAVSPDSATLCVLDPVTQSSDFWVHVSADCVYGRDLVVLSYYGPDSMTAPLPGDRTNLEIIGWASMADPVVDPLMQLMKQDVL